MSSDPELDNFKRTISLTDFAGSMGYAIDWHDSWSVKRWDGSFVMRNAQDDKIVVRRKPETGQWVYCSTRDESDQGSILDFLQKRTGRNIGEARKHLRAWSGTSAAPSLPAAPPAPVTLKDRAGVESHYRQMQNAPAHPYLLETRRLSPALLASPRLAGRVRIDDHRNAVFPHFDADGLCGYEIKNRGFTGFASGGVKGLWFSRTTPEDRRLVFAESAIDALSYATLFPDTVARYASIGGKLNPVQPGLIRATISRLPEGSEVIAAMDADAAGGALAAAIGSAFLDVARSDLSFRAHMPPTDGYDWNDVVRQSRPVFLPVARP
jgi:hypothetical protein